MIVDNPDEYTAEYKWVKEFCFSEGTFASWHEKSCYTLRYFFDLIDFFW